MRLRSIVSGLVATAALVALVSVPAYAVKTRLKPSELTQVLSHREWKTPVCAARRALTDGETLVGFVADKNYRMRGMRLSVGVPAGAGNTSVYLDHNAATVASSTLSIAGTGPQGTLTTLNRGFDRQVVAGDVLLLRVGAITTGSLSFNVGVCLDLVEDFD